MNINRARYAFLFTLMLVLLVAPAGAALNSHLELTDQPGGTPILGGEDQAGREGWVRVYELHHLMEVPGGQTTVDHQTVIVTVKLTDPSIPVLLQKMDTNGLVGVTIHLWEPNSSGGEDNYMDMTLTDAKVVSVEPLMPNNKVPELAGLEATARIRFSYATLQIEDLSTALTHTFTNSGN